MIDLQRWKGGEIWSLGLGFSDRFRDIRLVYRPETAAFCDFLYRLFSFFLVLFLSSEVFVVVGSECRGSVSVEGRGGCDGMGAGVYRIELRGTIGASVVAGEGRTVLQEELAIQNKSQGAVSFVHSQEGKEKGRGGEEKRRVLIVSLFSFFWDDVSGGYYLWCGLLSLVRAQVVVGVVGEEGRLEGGVLLKGLLLFRSELLGEGREVRDAVVERLVLVPLRRRRGRGGDAMVRRRRRQGRLSLLLLLGIEAPLAVVSLVVVVVVVFHGVFLAVLDGTPAAAQEDGRRRLRGCPLRRRRRRRRSYRHDGDLQKCMGTVAPWMLLRS
mmetsp:Transcript_23591/g.75729  ORF Transcript_23591/g.75729 Transcript_23591/m.75729 type:complete len:325 (-) Transcript_23591:1449-2423(-)